MRILCKTFLVLSLLTGAAGCCTNRRPPQPVPQPPQLGTRTGDPQAIANRLLTGLLIGSPLATASRASVYIATPPELPEYPQLVASLQHLAQRIATEPRLTLATRPEEADYRLVTEIEALPNVEMQLIQQGSGTIRWRQTQPLD